MMRAHRPYAAEIGDRTAPPETSHQDLVDASAREAARDAENAAMFLRELGFVPSVDRPVRLPPRFLLQLGAALRLLVWESSGLLVHQDPARPWLSRRSSTPSAYSKLRPIPGPGTPTRFPAR